MLAGRYQMLNYAISNPMSLAQSYYGMINSNNLVEAEIVNLETERLKLGNDPEFEKAKKEALQRFSDFTSKNPTKFHSVDGAIETFLNSSKEIIGFEATQNQKQKLLLDLKLATAIEKLKNSVDLNRKNMSLTLARYRITELFFPEFHNNPQSKDFQKTYQKLKQEIGPDIIDEELKSEANEFINTLFSQESPIQLKLK